MGAIQIRKNGETVMRLKENQLPVSLKGLGQKGLGQFAQLIAANGDRDITIRHAKKRHGGSVYIESSKVVNLQVQDGDTASIWISKIPWNYFGYHPINSKYSLYHERQKTLRERLASFKSGLMKKLFTYKK